MGRKYSIARSGITTVDGGDFFQLRNTTGRKVKILSLYVFQVVGTTLLMPGARITRGVGGAGGTARTTSIMSLDPTDAAAGMTAFELPTTDVGTVTWEGLRGWNILQEFVYLPIPDIQVPMAASDHLGIGTLTTGSIANVGIMIDWEEAGS